MPLVTSRTYLLFHRQRRREHSARRNDLDADAVLLVLRQHLQQLQHVHAHARRRRPHNTRQTLRHCFSYRRGVVRAQLAQCAQQVTARPVRDPPEHQRYQRRRPAPRRVPTQHTRTSSASPSHLQSHDIADVSYQSFDDNFWISGTKWRITCSSLMRDTTSSADFNARSRMWLSSPHTNSSSGRISTCTFSAPPRYAVRPPVHQQPISVAVCEPSRVRDLVLPNLSAMTEITASSSSIESMRHTIPRVIQRTSNTHVIRTLRNHAPAMNGINSSRVRSWPNAEAVYSQSHRSAQSCQLSPIAMPGVHCHLPIRSRLLKALMRSCTSSCLS